MTEKLIIRLDFEGSRGHFLREIQRQLDIVTLLLGGAEKATVEDCQARGFHNFSPAHGAELPVEEARSKAIAWLNKSFLREAIESTDQFLGRCLSFCCVIQGAVDGKTTGPALSEIIRFAPQRHHKLHFPAKLQKLDQEYGVRPAFSEHVLSLNKLRTCLVHRLGHVSHLDTSGGDSLVAKWVSSKMILRGLQSGTQVELTEPGQSMAEEAALEMHLVEHVKEFQIGTDVALDPYDTFSTIFTLWRFGLACSDEVERLALKSGLPVRKV